MDAEQQPAAPQVRVVAGGAPTPEELAALVVALTPTGGGAPARRGPVPWRRAAMLEGVGARRPTSPADLGVATLRG